jgi:PBSX family phage terminase large subunit
MNSATIASKKSLDKLSVAHVNKIKFTEVQKRLARLVATHRNTCSYGGAGSGKTIANVAIIVLRALTEPSRHLILRKRLAHVKASIWHESLPLVLELFFPNVKYNVHKADYFISFGNGSEIWIGGTDDKDRIDKVLGREVATIYLNECSQISLDAFLTLKTRLRQPVKIIKPRILLDCNPPPKSHWVYKYFILGQQMDKKPLPDPENYACIQMNPRQNCHLDEQYLLDLENQPARYKKRFYDGEFLDDTEGAMWKQSIIDENRVHYKNYNELINSVSLSYTAVAVDPATSKTENSNLTGIVAVAAGANLDKEKKEHYYTIADKTIQGTPKEWAEAAIDLYHKVDANVIVAEKNQGGDMVEAILRSAGFTGKVILVHASKGKFARAEPIEALYEQNLVHHLDNRELEELEEQMTTYVPHQLEGSDESPDRMDALVWALTHVSERSGRAKTNKRYDSRAVNNALSRYRGF